MILALYIYESEIWKEKIVRLTNKVKAAVKLTNKVIKSNELIFPYCSSTKRILFKKKKKENYKSYIRKNK